LQLIVYQYIKNLTNTQATTCSTIRAFKGIAGKNPAESANSERGLPVGFPYQLHLNL